MKRGVERANCGQLESAKFMDQKSSKLGLSLSTIFSTGLFCPLIELLTKNTGNTGLFSNIQNLNFIDIMNPFF